MFCPDVYNVLHVSWISFVSFLFCLQMMFVIYVKCFCLLFMFCTNQPVFNCMFGSIEVTLFICIHVAMNFACFIKDSAETWAESKGVPRQVGFLIMQSGFCLNWVMNDMLPFSAVVPMFKPGFFESQCLTDY